MINEIHALLHRPENGWDPVPAAHIARYTKWEWSSGVDEPLLDHLESWLGGFAGKRVLDLGGGPGQYSVAFALRGADVIWHDISTGYREFAARSASEHGVGIKFSLGYLDDAQTLTGGDFDLVFNRICWNYGFSDQGFAQELYSLVKPGGVGYVDTTHSRWRRETLSASVRFRTWLNDTLALKIGHPFPPHGRLAQLFLAMPVETLLIDYSLPTHDRITFRRCRETNG